VGIPSSSLTCEGFLGQAKATSVGLGLRGLAVAKVPGHVGVQSKEELARHSLESILPAVIANLTEPPAVGALTSEPRAGDIVCKGTAAEVNDYFLQNEWGDGLPVVPPTRERIAQFLKHTPRQADDVIGVMLPDRRTATVWSVAVNGVMAGCKPEYMPILVALAEAMADPAYGVEHSGNTPGAETLIILNGPIIKDLGFNYTQGVMRDGFLPNTSIGRFWRLYLRNVAGFLPHRTDKATFGNTWHVVVPENEDVIARLGWTSIAADMGLPQNTDAVTIARYTGGDISSSVSGSTPEEMLPYIADALCNRVTWQFTFTTSFGGGSLRPLVLLTPILAETIAKAGWSKLDTQKFLFEHARMPVWKIERTLRDWNSRGIWNITEEVRQGLMPKLFAESDDPNRLVPIVREPEHIMIAVTGDPLRTSAYTFSQNGGLGFPVSRRIVR